MKFIDECKIEITAGKGGNGIVSFRREAKVPRGGPDGGDGGNGGSIYFIGDQGTNTLLNVKYMQHIKAQPGENGRAKNQYGANGQDLIVAVPFGTLVYHGNKLICDITLKTPYLIAKGGRGGRGNTKFKSSINTAPRLSENGLPGDQYKIHLILKILADIGFVGKPSAGKSTLLSKISNAKPKIADYDFTTLTPQLGLVKVQDHSFVAADLPGLIAGAAIGKGLGHDFLKHIERCYVVAHVIDFGSSNKNPVKDYDQIRHELISYSLSLEKRLEVVIANKSDLPSFENHWQLFKKHYPQIQIVPISALREKNIEQLKYQLYDALMVAKKQPHKIDNNDEITISMPIQDEAIIVKQIKPHHFVVTGTRVKKIYDLIPLHTSDNFNRFNKSLKTLGVWKALENVGVKHGDIVKIYGYELQWRDKDD